MSILPDSNWINALKLPTQVVIGIFVACVVILVLDWREVLNLNRFGDIAKPITIVITVLSGSLSLTGVLSFCKEQYESFRKQSLLAKRRRIRAEEREEERIKSERDILKRLDHLSPNELRYLADCLRENSQSFYTYVYSPPVGALMGKRLVYTPGGTHHQDHYPYTVHDVVWKELLEHKDEFIERDNANKRREREKEEEEKRRRRRRY